MGRAALLLVLCAALLAPRAAHAWRLAAALPQIEASYAAVKAATPARLAQIEASITNPKYFLVKETPTTASYIAPSCWALFKLMLDLDSKVAAAKATLKTITVDLPCEAGNFTVKAGGSIAMSAWAAPDYATCYFPGVPELSAVGGNLALKFAPPPAPRGPALTLRAMATAAPGGCKKALAGGKRPLALGGGPAGNAEIPIIAIYGAANSSFGPTFTMQDVSLDGSKSRPGLCAGRAKKVALINVDVRNCWGTGSGAGLEIWDSPATYTCSKAAPCRVEGCNTTALDDPYNGGWIYYPQGGGALFIRFDKLAGNNLYKSDYVDYVNNTHFNWGGPFFVWKSVMAAVGISITNARIMDNTAVACAVGATFRDDGYIDPVTYQPVKGRTMTLNIPTSPSKPLEAFWSGNKPPPGVNTDPTSPWSNGRILVCGAMPRYAVNPASGIGEDFPWDYGYKTDLKNKWVMMDSWFYYAPLYFNYPHWTPEYAYIRYGNGTVARMDMGPAAAAALPAGAAARLAAAGGAVDPAEYAAAVTAARAAGLRVWDPTSPDHEWGR